MRGSIPPHQTSYPSYEPTRPVEDDPSWDMAAEAPAYVEPRKPRMGRAAMIAAAGYPKLLRGECAPWDMSADVSLRLPNVDVEAVETGKKVRYRL